MPRLTSGAFDILKVSNYTQLVGVKMEFYEPYSEERAKAAEDKAERVFHGQYQDYEEALMFLQYIISQHYGMPFFDPYFTGRTMDDLVFEAKLIHLQRTPKEQQNVDIVNKNKEEAVAEFDDWEDMEVENSQKFDDMAKEFMNTGNFKE